MTNAVFNLRIGASRLEPCLFNTSFKYLPPSHAQYLIKGLLGKQSLFMSITRS